MYKCFSFCTLYGTPTFLTIRARTQTAANSRTGGSRNAGGKHTRLASRDESIITGRNANLSFRYLYLYVLYYIIYLKSKYRVLWPCPSPRGDRFARRTRIRNVQQYNSKYLQSPMLVIIVSVRLTTPYVKPHTPRSR